MLNTTVKISTIIPFFIVMYSNVVDLNKSSSKETNVELLLTHFFILRKNKRLKFISQPFV